MLAKQIIEFGTVIQICNSFPHITQDPESIYIKTLAPYLSYGL